jgi:phage gp29-like protein
MKYSYAPLSRKLFVDILEYNAAYRAAESPSPDPRAMLAIIARFAEANTRIGGLIINAHDAISGFPWDITPSDPNNAQAVTVAAATKERFVRAGMHHNFDVMIDAEFFGMTGLRQVWNSIDGKWQASISVVPTTDLYRQKNGDGIFEPCLIDDNAMFKATPIAPEERNKYVICDFNPHKSTRPEFIGGLVRGAIPLTIIRQFNWEDWSLFTELFSQPFRKAEYKEGTSDKDKAVAKKALKEFGRNAWALVSENIKFDLMEAAHTGSVAAYEKLLEKVDAELEILIKGEASTAKLPESGGSRAALQVMKLIGDDRMWARLNRLQETINEQHIAVDYSLNESTTDISLRPHFEFTTNENEDNESNARIIADLDPYYEFDDAEVSKKVGFKVKHRTTPITGGRLPSTGLNLG